MNAHRWLLLLGSNLANDSRMTMALARLSRLGPVTTLTPIRRFSSHNGRCGDYFNALATLDSELERDALHARLKRIETALGRRNDATGRIAIDLDILACVDGDVWRADAHAARKREFEQPSVAALLRETGIIVADSNG